MSANKEVIPYEYLFQTSRAQEEKRHHTSPACGNLSESRKVLKNAVNATAKQQYLGDVTGYQAQIDALEEDKARLEAEGVSKDNTIEDLTDQLAEADETAIALYEELEAARAEAAAAEAAAPAESVPESKEVEAWKM